MKALLCRATLAAALLLPGLATAQDAESDPAFRVDLIVFLNQASPNGAPGEQSATVDAFELDASGRGPLPRSPGGDFGLEREWNNLRNARAFRPIYRASWTQSELSTANAPRYAINDGPSYLVVPVRNQPVQNPQRQTGPETAPRPGPQSPDSSAAQNAPALFAPPPQPALDTLSAVEVRQLDGVVRLTQRRFLHIDLDVWWAQPSRSGSASVVPGQPALESDMALFRLTESRRMRGGDVHYFDNPRFGALVKVTEL